MFLLFLRREFSAVCRAIGGDVPVNFLFVIFGLRGFRWRHLSAGDAIRDTLLLEVAASADLVVAVGRRIGIVFVVVNRLAEVVLLLINLPAFLRRHRSAIGGAVVVNFLVQARFAPSMFLVSPAVICPEEMPLAMRPCWL